MNSLRSAGTMRPGKRRMAMLVAQATAAIVALSSIASAVAAADYGVRDGGAYIKIGDPGLVRYLRLTISKSRTLKLSKPFGEALIANPGIADIVPLTDQSVYIVGKQTGLTRLTLLDSHKSLMGIIEVEVSYDIQGLRQELHNSVPGGDFSLRTANGRIVLAGIVPDAIALSKAVSITDQFTSSCEAQQLGEPSGAGNGGTVSPRSMTPGPANAQPGAHGGGGGPASKCFVNMLTVRAPQQVLLEVRFVEAQRNAARDLGFAWDLNGSRIRGLSGLPAVATLGSTVLGGLPSSGVPFGAFVARVLDGGTTADVLIQALEKRGVARRLAEPNLVTLSGDTANFLAGGEFPFPVASDNNKITIEFKKFGIGLAFTPTVLSDSQINLKIEPEVSDLDPNNTILVANTSIPSLIVRRASTTVELRDGQSFAIAGLLQSKHTKSTRELPWISQVPVLGTLFRSASYEKNDSDLVIIVTPRLVRPAKPGQQLVTPLDQRLPGNDRDYFLRGQLEVPKHFDAPYGHILEISQPVAAYVHKETGHAAYK